MFKYYLNTQTLAHCLNTCRKYLITFNLWHVNSQLETLSHWFCKQFMCSNNESSNWQQLPIFSVQFLPRCMECRRGLAMRILSVRPSVRPSVTRVNCDKTVERSVQIYIPYERTFSLVFWEEEWLVVGGPFYLKFWVNRPPLEQNRRFLTDNRS